MAQDEGRFVSGDQDAGGHVDEGTVHAWLDGQLGAEESARVEAHVASCEACSGMVAEARGFVAASSRILTALDGVPARVLPRQRGRLRVWQVRAAAAVVVMALGVAAVLERGGSTIAFTRHEVASTSPEAAGAVAQSQREQGAPSLVPERRSTAASPPVAAPMPAAPEPVAPMADEAREKEQKTPPRRVGNQDARSEQLRKDLNEESSNRLAGAKSAATTDLKAGGVGGVAGGGGIALRGVPSNANAPASAPSMAAQGEPAARQRLRDSLFSRPPVATDSGYVPVRIQRQITGRVVDSAARTPIAGATVGVARTSVATTTNDTGAFVLQAAPHDTLDVRRIGYSPRRVALSPQQRDTTITLVESPLASTLALSQTVVTGALDKKLAAEKERRITGHVVDSATHNPVAGATVVIAGTAGGALTDSTGGFTIVAPTGTVTFVVRCVGYKPVFVTVSPDRGDTTIVVPPAPLLLPTVPATTDSTPPR